MQNKEVEFNEEDDSTARSQGWFVSSCIGIEDDWRIERMDEAAVFESDHDAMDFVIKTAKLGNEAAISAIEFLTAMGAADADYLNGKVDREGNVIRKVGFLTSPNIAVEIDLETGEFISPIDDEQELSAWHNGKANLQEHFDFWRQFDPSYGENGAIKSFDFLDVEFTFPDGEVKPASVDFRKEHAKCLLLSDHGAFFAYVSKGTKQNYEEGMVHNATIVWRKAKEEYVPIFDDSPTKEEVLLKLSLKELGTLKADTTNPTLVIDDEGERFSYLNNVDALLFNEGQDFDYSTIHWFNYASFATNVLVKYPNEEPILTAVSALGVEDFTDDNTMYIFNGVDKFDLRKHVGKALFNDCMLLAVEEDDGFIKYGEAVKLMDETPLDAITHELREQLAQAYAAELESNEYVVFVHKLHLYQVSLNAPFGEYESHKYDVKEGASMTDGKSFIDSTVHSKLNACETIKAILAK